MKLCDANNLAEISGSVNGPSQACRLVAAGSWQLADGSRHTISRYPRLSCHGGAVGKRATPWPAEVVGKRQPDRKMHQAAYIIGRNYMYSADGRID